MGIRDISINYKHINQQKSNFFSEKYRFVVNLFQSTTLIRNIPVYYGQTTSGELPVRSIPAYYGQTISGELPVRSIPAYYGQTTSGEPLIRSIPAYYG